MKEQTPLKTLRNRCISCAYLCISRQMGRYTQEIQDAERKAIMNREFPEGYKPPVLSCYRRWVLPEEIEKLSETKCSSKEWKAHKDGLHPEAAERLEKRRKERMDIVRWAIGIILTVAVLVLTIYSVFFRN